MIYLKSQNPRSFALPLSNMTEAGRKEISEVFEPGVETRLPYDIAWRQNTGQTRLWTPDENIEIDEIEF